MKLSDIVKGMLAPVVKFTGFIRGSRDECECFYTRWGGVSVSTTRPLSRIVGNRGEAVGFVRDRAHYEPYVSSDDIKSVEIGAIRFSLWREPTKPKLRRVA